MRSLLAASLIALLPLSNVSVAHAQAPPDRQQAFEAAAEEFQVPESVLLGVSYLESRWDTHAGQPSSDAGFGPMHLTDAAGFTASNSNHHGQGQEDARGDDSRPLPVHEERPAPADLPATLRTMERAAQLTGESRERLRADPAANIRGGAALLADYQKALGAPLSDDPAQWYGAVARYAGADDAGSAKYFADEVFATIKAGAERTTDDGQRVKLTAVPGLEKIEKWLEKLGLRPPVRPDGLECPASISCEWIPAAYQELPNDDYGHYDLANRPQDQKIDYIVIHDMEGYFGPSIGLNQDPTYGASWQYSIRSTDGHVAQHIKAKDVGWQAGNWYINSKSIGIEHEGFLAEGATWYTEAMYRSSARLVRYLALRYDVPMDRAHILGHDNVPGTIPSTVQGMHEDPGPFWDWAHYFQLMGAPLHQLGGPRSGAIMIKPDFATNKPYFYGCDRQNPEADCPPLSAGTVWLRTEPREDAPLVKDIGKHPTGESLYSVYDHSARATTGQRFAVAARQGDWMAIWYLGQKAWFHNPAAAPTAVPSKGLVVTPKPGKATVPVYGRAYPEQEAYPEGIPYQAVTPLQYTFSAGEKYTLAGEAPAEYYRAVTFDQADHQVVRGKTKYLEIQFGHRVMYVKADDVRVTFSG